MVIEKSVSATITSTITDRPERTLSSAVVLTTVNSVGKTSLTIPPIVTILSTSTEANGSFVTFTHVVANPTGFQSANLGDSGWVL